MGDCQWMKQVDGASQTCNSNLPSGVHFQAWLCPRAPHEHHAGHLTTRIQLSLHGSATTRPSPPCVFMVRYNVG